MSRPKRVLALRPDPGSNVPEVAMVMAAGLGKRMRPLTATRPKPLVQVAGRALIDHALDKLAAAGVKKAVVNVHYLADSVKKMDALLLLVPLANAHCHLGRGDFHMKPDGRLSRRRPRGVAPFVYTGIQILSKRLFEEDTPEGPFSTNLLWDRAIEAGRCFGTVHQGLWFDIGQPQNIRKTEELLGNV